MNRRRFVLRGLAAASARPRSIVGQAFLAGAPATKAQSRIVVLLVDVDRQTTRIDKGIYGQFLEHINHSVEDGLFAEQIRGAGFEGKDFALYWQPEAERGRVEAVNLPFQNGTTSVRLQAEGGRASIQQGRLFLEKGVRYEGLLWAKHEGGSPGLTVRLSGSDGAALATLSLPVTGSDWRELPFAFTSPVRDTQATIQIAAAGHGTLLVDFVSMMRADVRHNGMLRPDLFQAFDDLHPSFVRWPGGSFASTYKWKEGIGRYAARGYHPNTFWGGYSDYFGFGTDEFLQLCRRLGAEPLITLPAPGTKAEQIEYAMDWVHYLNDPPTTEWGRRRVANGHAEPYGVKLFQIDNEPMNNGFTPEAYAEIVNVYAPRVRAISPEAKIVACGQKRSNDMDWSEKVIDLAGANFDVLGCHNYEYEPENYASGLERIRDYLSKLRDYVRASKHPGIQLAVLEWSLQHTFDWRAGLHAAGSLMLYEELSPALTMTCPALLMRNTTDDPKWTSAIYHDHVSWFPGGSYPVEKMFREHYAEQYVSSAYGTFRDVPDRGALFDKMSTAIPSEWQPETVHAIATKSTDGRSIVLKAVNYEGRENTLLVGLRGAKLPRNAKVTVSTLSAGLTESASMTHPDAFTPASHTMPYGRDMEVKLPAYSVVVVQIAATDSA